MRYFYEEVASLTTKFGLSVPPPSDRLTVPIGNGVTQDQTIESSCGRSIRQMEEKVGLTRGDRLLGERFRRLENLDNPLAKARTQVILFAGHYSVQLCRMNPDLSFIFGDNGVRTGMGGQATIRNEPNAVGVATKRLPGGKDEFFVEGDADDMGLACLDLAAVERQLAVGRRIVLPITPEGRISLGCGLANLPYHAPTIYAFIERWFDATCRNFKTTRI